MHEKGGVHELALTVTRLLVGLWVSTVDMRDRLPDLYAVVWNALAARLAREVPADGRIAALFRGGGSAFDALRAVLENAF